MAEAQRLMADPKFQKEMKKLAENQDFKDSIKKTTEGLKDPAQAAKMEARLEHMLKVGNENLKKGATDSMRQAMDAMNDPAVMQQMTQMMKDPQMQAKIQQMMKDPQFQQYAEAVS